MTGLVRRWRVQQLEDSAVDAGRRAATSGHLGAIRPLDLAAIVRDAGKPSPLDARELLAARAWFHAGQQEIGGADGL